MQEQKAEMIRSTPSEEDSILVSSASSSSSLSPVVAVLHDKNDNDHDAAGVATATVGTTKIVVNTTSSSKSDLSLTRKESSSGSGSSSSPSNNSRESLSRDNTTSTTQVLPAHSDAEDEEIPASAVADTDTDTDNENDHAPNKIYYIVLDELTPDLQRLLECPICHSTSVPPIYLCAQGHIICHLCRVTHPKCLKCGSGFTSMRNELAECIVSRIHFKCAYDGCAKEPIFGNQVEEHLKTCDFRPILCNIHTSHGKREFVVKDHHEEQAKHHRTCSTLIPYPEYLQHLKDKHEMIGVQSSSSVVKMSTTVKFGQGNWTFPPQYLSAYGQTFLCHLHASFNLFIGWISLYGPADEARNFAGSVSIFNPEQKWKEVRWRGQVHPLRSTSQQVYDSGNCLIILPETFLLFVQVEDPSRNGRTVKKWDCHFEVFQIVELEEEQEEKRVEEVEVLEEELCEDKSNNNSNINIKEEESNNFESPAQAIVLITEAEGSTNQSSNDDAVNQSERNEETTTITVDR